VPVIIGTVGTPFIDQLVQTRKLEVYKIKGQWESYVQAVVRNPVKGVSRALVIAGSDRRGTTYGIYDTSERIGVCCLGTGGRTYPSRPKMRYTWAQEPMYRPRHPSTTEESSSTMNGSS
jgi:hypothetical protein